MTPKQTSRAMELKLRLTAINGESDSIREDLGGADRETVAYKTGRARLNALIFEHARLLEERERIVDAIFASRVFN